MALKTTNIDSEIERVDGLLLAVEVKIGKAFGTLQKHKKEKEKFANMRGRLAAMKSQAIKFNKLDKKK
jgi:hypothetical protein